MEAELEAEGEVEVEMVMAVSIIHHGSIALRIWLLDSPKNVQNLQLGPRRLQFWTYPMRNVQHGLKAHHFFWQQCCVHVKVIRHL